MTRKTKQLQDLTNPSQGLGVIKGNNEIPYIPGEVTQEMFSNRPDDAVDLYITTADDLPEWIRQYGSVYHKTKLLDQNGNPTVSHLWSSPISDQDAIILRELRTYYIKVTHAIEALIAL